MGKVIQYQILESEPGYFKAMVQFKGPFRNIFWKAIGYHGENQAPEYGATEFSVKACERLIKKHKERLKTPWKPKVVYRETQ